MGARTALDAGAAALAAGRWRDAGTAYARALRDGRTGAALEGLAEASWWLGDATRCARLRALGYTAYRRDGDPLAAARVALAAAVGALADQGNGPAARGWLARAQRLLGADAGPLSGWLDVVRGYVSDDPAVALAAAERALGRARQDGDVDLELVALADSGSVLVAQGRTREGLDRLDEAMAAALAGEARRLDTVVFVCCDMLHACETAGDAERAEHWCRVADDFTRRYGCPFLYATCRTAYGGVLLAAGRWDGAERQLETARRSAAGAAPGVRDRVLLRLADLRVQQGRLEEAELLLRGVEDPDAALPAAELHLARGEPSLAVALLRASPGDDGVEDAGGGVEDAGGGAGRTPRRVGDRPRALLLTVRAAVAAGDVPAAQRAAERLTALAGDGAPRAGALAALARAELALAGDDPAAAAGQLRAAVSLLAGRGAPLEAARARLALAGVLERADPAGAVTQARRAVVVLDALGARRDADAAAALLRRLGDRRTPASRAAGPLTAREQEVLALLGQGLTNPQIARRLVISPRTAAHHVSAVLAKLGVANRTQAAALVARDR